MIPPFSGHSRQAITKRLIYKVLCLVETGARVRKGCLADGSR
jgi:hypothetical protein